MNPLPPPLGPGDIRLWRIDQDRHAPGWNSGEGAFRVGGRWNSGGVRAVYAALDPATATMEMAVHKGFDVLDKAPHTLSSARITDPLRLHVVRPEDVPNPPWLTPALPSRNQQLFGNDLLRRFGAILIPSAVSRHSWNLIFDAGQSDLYDDVTQERFALNPRLQAP